MPAFEIEPGVVHLPGVAPPGGIGRERRQGRRQRLVEALDLALRIAAGLVELGADAGQMELERDDVEGIDPTVQPGGDRPVPEQIERERPVVVLGRDPLLGLA